MVTNLPAEAKAKFIKYMDAKTPEEKLKALEEFLSYVPKHKGTENLVRWARKRMAELREEINERKRKSMLGGTYSFFVEKEGAAQIILVGYTKSGKSSILKSLTNANVEISEIPYTTKYPAVGMLPYEDIQFQLVEAPSIIPHGGGWNNKVIGLVKNSDGIIIVLDASKNLIEEFNSISMFLKDHGVYIEKPRGYVVIERGYSGGIRIVNYGVLRCTENDVVKLLNSYRIYNAIVKIYGEVDIDDVEKSLFESIIHKPTLILVNKIDLMKSREELKELMNYIPKEIPVIGISTITKEGLNLIGSELFKILNIVRIYTKPPMGKPAEKPLVLKRGATVLDVAKAIHKDLFEKFSYARIWGSSVKFPGQRVGGDHIVEDRDIVEINIKK